MPPYPEERGGVVLSTTVDRYAYTTLIPREDDCISVNSLDYDIVVKFNPNGQLSYDEKLGTVLGKAMVASRIGGILFSEGRLCQQLLGLYHSLIKAENGGTA
jgi:galactokinase/mevalonate kinase-like predicted kinase